MFNLDSIVALSLILMPATAIQVQATPSNPPLLIANETEISLEAAVLAEINRVRSNPQAYADWLATLKPYYQGTELRWPEQQIIKTEEGIAALEEAIAFLNALQPLPPLNASEKLNPIAQRLATSQANLSPEALTTTRETVSTFEHSLSYGETAQIIVMQLIVDDGIATRNSRKRLLRNDLQSNGVVCQPQAELGHICAIAYSASPAVVTESPDTVVPETPEVDPPRLAVVIREQGSLEDGDNIMPSDSSLYDFYPFEGYAGQSLRIVLESGDFDTFVAIVDENDNIIAQNDDISEQDTNSLVRVTLPKDGLYYIIVNSYDAQGRGSYTLSVEDQQ